MCGPFLISKRSTTRKKSQSNKIGDNDMERILVTGGAGFIGCNFVRYMLEKYPQYSIVIIDKLTYAGNMRNLEELVASPLCTFVTGDICNAKLVNEVVSQNRIDVIVNFAAETHIDRCFMEPEQFIVSNSYGAYVLLEAARKFPVVRFIQVSTDKVYGPTLQGAVKEDVPLSPRTVYAVSKAAAEMLVKAYYLNYGVPASVIRGSNTFGPYQFPEKLVPLAITNAIDSLPIPIYGSGEETHDWLYVIDHCRAIDVVLHNGEPGEAYNVCADNQLSNLEVVHAVLKLLDAPAELIKHVSKRLYDDPCCAPDSTKLRRLGWQPEYDFDAALGKTVLWYLNNQEWWRRIKGSS